MMDLHQNLYARAGSGTSQMGTMGGAQFQLRGRGHNMQLNYGYYFCILQLN